MRFDVLTLFPELFAAHGAHGVTRRAFESKQVDVRLWPLREFGMGAHQRVDDRPFGGGPGMVMQAPVLAAALQAVRLDRMDARDANQRVVEDAAPVILMSPAGRKLDQALVREIAQGPGGIIVAGRYEGVDQRFIERHVTLELSVGDYVLSGGELPALILLDAVARLQEGVLHDPESHGQDSFGESCLLDCPHYTQPPEWEGMAVPNVLSSGHHARVARWRREQALSLTHERRPDLIAAARRAGRLTPEDEAWLAGQTDPAGL